MDKTDLANLDQITADLDTLGTGSSPLANLAKSLNGAIGVIGDLLKAKGPVRPMDAAGADDEGDNEEQAAGAARPGKEIPGKPGKKAGAAGAEVPGYEDMDFAAENAVDVTEYIAAQGRNQAVLAKAVGQLLENDRKNRETIRYLTQLTEQNVALSKATAATLPALSKAVISTNQAILDIPAPVHGGRPGLANRDATLAKGVQGEVRLSKGHLMAALSERLIDNADLSIYNRTGRFPENHETLAKKIAALDV